MANPSYTAALQALKEVVKTAPRGSEVHRRCQSALIALQNATKPESKRGS